MPFVARTGALAPQLIGIILAKLATPYPDGLIHNDDTTGKQQLFDIPIAEAEPIVEPDAMANGWREGSSLATSALYPPSTDEKCWVDGVLARKKGLGL